MSRITMTDGYKFSMAEAGFPLRTETFYYTQRRGGANGWHFIPVDLDSYIKDLLPKNTEDVSYDYDYLDQNSYSIGAATRKAIESTDSIKVTAMPVGSWFYSREPAFSVTGPSALVSWLEPMALMLHFLIQVATQAKIYNLPVKMIATCEDEKEIILRACATANRKAPEIEVNSEQYYNYIFGKAKSLVSAVKNPDRIFEVGMRGASCMEQHRIALRAIKAAGILRTSNVYLAQELGMIPVGTMGHEHIQRFGSDYIAFTTMRDRFPGFISYLPDTFDSIRSGIPAAIKAIMERPDRKSGIRFDSEDRIRNHYWYTLTEMQRLNINQMLILESGWNLKKTLEFETYREIANWPAELQSYGFGGYLIKPEWQTFERDDVAAVWKLTNSLNPTMKFSDDTGKQSSPGLPVAFRPHPMHMNPNMPVGIIGQNGENIDNHYCASESGNTFAPDLNTIIPTSTTKYIPPVNSQETQRLVEKCQVNRQANFNIYF